jgi:predicted Rossmann fold nucleotide-binding protein DprA/Smf involved in DNA uptake
MEQLANAFGDNAEVILNSQNRLHSGHANASPQEVLALVSRRPCTLEDIAASLDLDLIEASKCIEQLAVAGLVETEQQGRWLYFRGSYEAIKCSERGDEPRCLLFESVW